jgi:hypothetical protein
MKLIKGEIEWLTTNPRTTLALLCVILEFAVLPLALSRIQNLIPITMCLVIEMSLSHHNQQKRADLPKVSTTMKSHEILTEGRGAWRVTM